MKNKVVLFYPPYEGPPLGAPLCLLSLAAPLLGAGFRVSVIDGAIVPDFENVIGEEIKDALCFGISLLTGPMIRTAITAARRVRKARPDLPVSLARRMDALTAHLRPAARWCRASPSPECRSPATSG